MSNEKTKIVTNEVDINNNMAIVNQRYEWVDVLKALGIIAIYLGHCVDHTGKLHLFLYTYHVPLFFFVAGFFCISKREMSFKNYIKNKVSSILIPYLWFSIAYILMIGIAKSKGDILSIFLMIKQTIFGIRNQLPADSLWFLPCLFVISIMYEALYRIFKDRRRVLLCSVILFIITQTIFPQNPLTSPAYFFNIDSAMYYIIYYALGSEIFTYIKKFSYKSLNRSGKSVFVGSIILFSIIAVTVFLVGRDSILEFMGMPNLINSILIVIVALIMIYLNIILSWILRKNSYLQVLGKSTLILCGTEQLLKAVIRGSFLLIGLNVDGAPNFIGITYAMICFLLSYDIVIPMVSKLLQKRNAKQ